MMTKINADNLKYLTLRQKKAAILMLEGKSYVEISKILGCSNQPEKDRKKHSYIEKNDISEKAYLF